MMSEQMSSGFPRDDDDDQFFITWEPTALPPAAPCCRCGLTRPKQLSMAAGV